MLGDNSLSFVLCAHNARDRIGDCLSHLSRQRLIVGQGYEVVLVDNGSTDGTADLARQVWQREGATAPLRVVPEPRLGLVHARLTGIRAARHEVLSFVDDDTWMAPDWVATALRTMEEHPTVGLVGAEGEARFPADGGPPGSSASATAMRWGRRDRLAAGPFPWGTSSTVPG
ncbi:glycosyltransferase family 2 protein [Aerophototrophica crusticola]|uniref:Glycosyltransferase family 2 protein n=1 Tax=Aerophototrophica crusticola TaxID=1709002 RepID=A0A858R784_9PROT|nr:glycosyltransferase family 2 protein [Rhodospirillaceae bacterium B3]